jgi:hypothetical protein
LVTKQYETYAYVLYERLANISSFIKYANSKATLQKLSLLQSSYWRLAKILCFLLHRQADDHSSPGLKAPGFSGHANKNTHPTGKYLNIFPC